VEEEATRVWIDAGPGTFFSLMDLMDPGLVTAVVLSHHHGDHVSGLFAALHWWGHGPQPREGVPLLAPAETLDRITAFLPGSNTLETVFRFDEIGDADVRTATFRSTDHSVPTLGSRWSNGPRSLAYSADTGPGGEWTELAEGVDLFVCEASIQGERASDSYPHHLTAAEAGMIARSRHATRLMLTHIPPHLDPERSLREAERTFDRPVALAVPGTTHKVMR
jgi:ribonuclease BN (tRNA processing enzyme)